MENTFTIKNPTAYKTVLLIDDNPHRREILATWLEMANFSVSSAGSTIEGLTLAKRQVFALILINSHPIGYDGAELCRQLRDVNKRTPILLYSGDTQNAEEQADWERRNDPFLACA